MRKVVLAAAAVAAVAVPGSALAADNYNPNPHASACGLGHGAFGAIGKDNNFAGGADGRTTGSLNSSSNASVHDPEFVGCN